MQQLAALILSASQRIQYAISTGAAWEIWIQVELLIMVRTVGFEAARETPYPNNNNAKLDLLMKNAGHYFAIELKVESAHNSGHSLISAIDKDVNKIASYNAANTTRWVVSIAYSDTAKNTLHTLAQDHARNAIYDELNGIGVFIITV